MFVLPLLISLLFLPAVTSAGPQQANQAQADEEQGMHDLYYGVHLPNDRAASRKLDLASELIGEQRYSEALPLLLAIAQLPEDSIYGVRSTDTNDAVSLKSKAVELLAKLPPKGQQAYSLVAEASARRALSEAVTSGSFDQLGEVLRLHPRTAAATSAAWLLANRAFDKGHQEQASALLALIEEDPEHVKAFEPQLTLMRTTLKLSLDQPTPALETFEQLINQPLRVPVRLGSTTLESANLTTRVIADQFPALQAAIRPAVSELAGTWPTAGGNPRRNVVATGGVPHLWPRWRNRVTTDPQLEETYQEFVSKRRQSQHHTATAASPVAVGDMVVMRATDRLVGVDWKTGRRVWETRPEDVKAFRSVRHQYEFGQQNESSDALLANPKIQTTWYDVVGQSLSSDGERVFAIAPNQADRANTQSGWGLQAFRGRRSRNRGFAETNRLIAYELSTQGKLAWQADGSDELGSHEGYFFLETPLSAEGHLLVTAERDQTIHLLELDPQDGTVLWSQPLVSVENGINQNLMRRMVGTSTSYAGGTAYCSTGAGIVAAVDLVQRKLQWVHRLPVEGGKLDHRRTAWQQRPDETWPRDADKKWQRNRAIIAGDRLLVTSPESSEVHCLNLTTGESLWRRPKGKGLFLAGADSRRALITSAGEARALDLQTGQPLWTTVFPADCFATGESLLEQTLLLVPASAGRLLAFDLNTGKSKATLRTGTHRSLGSLIAHRDAVVSQNFRYLDRYDLQQALLARTRSQLKSNPDDSAALSILGEAALSSGQLDEAIDQFARAYRADRDSILAADRLRLALLRRIHDPEDSQTGPAAADLALLEEVLDSAEDKLELQSLTAAAAWRRGDLDEVFSVTLRAVDGDWHDNELSHVSSTRAARPARRLAGLVSRAWQQASEEQRAGWNEQLVRRSAWFVDSDLLDRFRPAVTDDSLVGGSLAGGKLDQQVRFVQLFGHLSLGDGVRQQLVANLTAQGRVREATYHQQWLSDAASLAVGRASRYSPGESAYEFDPRWSQQQIALQLESRKSNNNARQRQQQRNRPVVMSYNVPLRRLASISDSQRSTPVRLITSTDSRTLVGLNTEGQTAFRLDLQGHAQNLTLRIRKKRAQEAWYFDGCLLMPMGNQLMAFDVARSGAPSGEADEALRWSNEPNRAWLSDSNARVRVTDKTEVTVLGISRTGIVLQRGTALACVDRQTGETQWEHTDLRFFIKQAAVAGDELFTVNKRGETKRFDLIDGEELGQWDCPPGDWVAYHHGLLTTVEAKGRSYAIAITSLIDGSTVYEQTIRPGNMSPQIKEERLVFIRRDESSNDDYLCEAIDTRTGELLFSRPLDMIALLGKKPVYSIQSAWQGDSLLLAINRRTTQQMRMLGVRQPDKLPLFSGPLLCLDGRTGETRWQAEVDGYSLIEYLPQSSPLIVLGRRVENTSSPKPIRSIEWLALDATTGRSVYRSPRMPMVQGFMPRIKSIAGSWPELVIAMPEANTTLMPTDHPAPPGPPASDDVEAPRKAGISSLEGVGRGLGRAFGGAIRPKTRQQSPQKIAEDDDD